MSGRTIPLAFFLPAVALLWAMAAINGFDAAMVCVATLVSIELWLCRRTTRGEKRELEARPQLSRVAVRGRVRPIQF